LKIRGEEMAQRKRRKRQQPGRLFHILILIIILLFIFEANILINMFKKENIKKNIQTNGAVTEKASSEKELSTNTNVPETDAQIKAASPVPQIPDSPCVVHRQDTSVDDSYFSDAVFIGDSRMEGFRNQSGISTGTFLTGVGMDAENIFETPFISTESGNITVYQALYNSDYKKVYIMLGTNNLGDYNYDDFKEKYRICLGEIRKILPKADFYVMEVAYVEESKVTTGDYVNNSNIDKLNEKILELCEQSDYNYIAINEVLSDGNRSLIKDASSDGVHIYDSYCKLWLDYLKSHYVNTTDDTTSDTASTETD